MSFFRLTTTSAILSFLFIENSLAGKVSINGISLEDALENELLSISKNVNISSKDDVAIDQHGLKEGMKVEEISSLNLSSRKSNFTDFICKKEIDSFEVTLNSQFNTKNDCFLDKKTPLDIVNRHIKNGRQISVVKSTSQREKVAKKFKPSVHIGRDSLRFSATGYIKCGKYTCFWSNGPIEIFGNKQSYKDCFFRSPTGIFLSPSKDNENSLIKKITIYPKKYFYTDNNGHLKVSYTTLIQGELNFTENNYHLTTKGRGYTQVDFNPIFLKKLGYTL